MVADAIGCTSGVSEDSVPMEVTENWYRCKGVWVHTGVGAHGFGCNWVLV